MGDEREGFPVRIANEFLKAFDNTYFKVGKLFAISIGGVRFVCIGKGLSDVGQICECFVTVWVRFYFFESRDRFDLKVAVAGNAICCLYCSG